MTSFQAARSVLAPRRAELLLDSAIALVVFAASLGLVVAGSHDGHGRAVDAAGVLLVALASLPLVARRRAPLGVFVITALASTLLSGFFQPAGPPLGSTLALYWVAASSSEESRERVRFTLAVVVAMALAHVTAGGLAKDGPPVIEFLFAATVWGGAWLAGDRTRLRHQRMADLEERARRAERETERERRLAAAEERSRIARDLHDSAGHAINVILVHAGLGRLRTGQDPDGVRRAFETIEEVARETVGEIDQMVNVLREDAPGHDEVEPPPGLAALEPLVARHRNAGMEVTVAVTGTHARLAPSIERAAFRILQEALTNAARHGAGSAHVEVGFGDDALDMSVSNPLRPDSPAGSPGGGLGLIGMHERAALLGGSLEAGVVDGEFRIHARLPFVGGSA